MIGENYPDDVNPWPRVSAIIRGGGLTSGFMPDEFYLDRGQKVHAACEFLDEGDLNRDDLDPALAGYVRAWERFKDYYGVKVIAIEQRVWNPEHRYKGRLDRLVDATFGKAVLDLKCGGPMAGYGSQLAAYQNCLENPEGWLRVGAHLFPDGRFKISGYPKAGESDILDWERFLGALEQFKIIDK